MIPYVKIVELNHIHITGDGDDVLAAELGFKFKAIECYDGDYTQEMYCPGYEYFTHYFKLKADAEDLKKNHQFNLRFRNANVHEIFKTRSKKIRTEAAYASGLPLQLYEKRIKILKKAMKLQEKVTKLNGEFIKSYTSENRETNPKTLFNPYGYSEKEMRLLFEARDINCLIVSYILASEDEELLNIMSVEEILSSILSKETQ